MEEFVEAKSEHERALLLKFSELLNAKKAKIRDLMRAQGGGGGGGGTGGIIGMGWSADFD